MAEKQKYINENDPEYRNASEISNSIPHPVADIDNLEFNDLKKGQIKKSSFIVRNIGGPFKEMELFVVDAYPFVKITSYEPLFKDQAEKMPVRVCFEATAFEWSKRYKNTIVIRLDDEDEIVTVELDTQTKPVNDFSRILKSQDIKIITALIDRLERNTSVEITVVTVYSLEGETIESYTNNLFNEWGVGKEDKNNGIMFLIDTETNMYRLEVGLGLEEVIDHEFINTIYSQYALPNFKANRFGQGIIQIIKNISLKLSS